MRYTWSNFNGGLASEVLEGRYNLAKYPTLAKKMKNFIPQVHGAVKRRSGLKFLAVVNEVQANADDSEIQSSEIIIPFVFNTEKEHNYVLVFETSKALQEDARAYIHVYSLEEGKIASIESPYVSSVLIENKIALSYAQVGDIIYLAHKDYPLHKIMRSGSSPHYNWAIEEVHFNTSLLPPTQPLAHFYSGPVQSGQSVAAQNYELKYKVVAVDEEGISSIASLSASAMGRYATEWIVGDYVQISWQAVAGAVEYNIYKEAVGYYGYIGTTTALSFRDQNYEADITDTPQEDYFPFENGNNPSFVTFHQQRMVLAGTKKQAQTFYMSRAGDFENFRKSRPLQDDAPIEYTLASGSIDAIQWAVSFGDLLIGTAGAEYKVSGNNGTGSPITAKEVLISTQSYFGSTKIPPIIIGNSVLHAQKYNAKIRDLYYSLEKDGYAGNDLTLLTPDLFGKYALKQWCFQQNPNSTLFCIREDGKCFSLTYLKEQEVFGWAEHETQGKFISLCTISGKQHDIVVFLVERTIGTKKKLCLEYLSSPFDQDTRLEECCFLDSSVSFSFDETQTRIAIPEHLKDADVMMLVNGSMNEVYSIENDEYVFQNVSVKELVIGLSYESILSMMPINADTEQGSTLGLKRSYAQCLIKMHRSIGGKYGYVDDFSKMYDFKLSPKFYNTAYELYSGEYSFNFDHPLSSEVNLFIGKDDALPLEILSLVVDVKFMENIA